MEVKGSTTADNSCTGNLFFACAFEGNIDGVKSIISKGGPLPTDTVGMTALHCAVMGNQIEITRLLLYVGINIDSKTKVDRTPLHLAAFYGHESMVEMLLDKNCTVDPTDLLSMTPLHWAVEREHPKVVRLLLERGANPKMLSKFNKTPYDIALAKKRLDIIRVFDTEAQTQGTKESNEASRSLVMEMRMEQSDSKTYSRNLRRAIDHSSDFVIPEVDDEEEEEGDVEEGEHIETLSLEEDDDVVEVIPVSDTQMNHDEDMASDSQNSGQVVAQDSDESLLNETINKLGHIRGLKATDVPTLKMLQNIGIQMAEDQDHTIIANVLQSGRRIVLSEAGKHILSRTKSSEMFQMPRSRSIQQVDPVEGEPGSSPTSTSTPVSNRLVNNNKKKLSTSGADANAGHEAKRAKLTDMDELLLEQPTTDCMEQEGDTQMPLSVVQKLEKQMGELKKENQQLRALLGVAMQRIDESQKRIDRLEKQLE